MRRACISSLGVFMLSSLCAREYLFSSESVTEGHPDKVCDQISDAILDAHLAQDPSSRVACNVVAMKGQMAVTGEITSQAQVDIEQIVRSVLKEIGYTKFEYGVSADECKVLVSMCKQSSDIAKGVDGAETKEQGAGDQGMMVGFACTETPELMPLPIMLSHHLVKKLADVRKAGILPWLRPDGKAQVTVAYKDGKPHHLTTVVVSAQHEPSVSHDQIEQDIIREVITPVCGQYLTPGTRYFINPTGSFVQGGPLADSGLTGRKIIVDTYGSSAEHGGGAFSGKDPSKVDRSAAYMARHIAKNIVAAGLAERCKVQIAYSIGVAEPVSIYVNCMGTGRTHG